MGVSCASAVSSEVPRLVDTDGDGIYTGSLTLPAGHNNVVTYKFGAYYPGVESVTGANGAMDNEAGFGADRVLYIPSQTSGNIALETTFGENNPDNPWLNITSSSVTFHVDMNGQTVSANGVHVAGNFGDYDYDGTPENEMYPNWDPAGIALTDDDSDGVYSVTLDLVPGTIEYKFINGNAWGGESDDEWAGEDNDFQPCRSGGGNRTITIGDTDLDVGLVCWERCIPCDEVYVTLRVDMEYETVSENGVHVAGSFQGWDPAATMMTAENDSSTVYHYQFGSTPGTQLQYKFVNGMTWDDAETVPADCATDGNRTHVVGDNDYVADAICYNQCGTCTPPATAAITFQGDMSQLLSYGFDPSIHTLELRGPMNGWSAGDAFVVDALDPNLYAITKDVTAVPGDPVEWKFKANPDASWNNSGWETSANRTFIFTGEAQVLDPEIPAILPTGELQNEVTVDMAVTWREGTLNVNDGNPFPQAPDTIIFNGSFLNCWCTWGDCMGVSCASAVSSEVPRLVDTDGDGIYTGSLTLPAGHNNVVTYKFGAYYPGVESVTGANGAMDNEAGFGADRVLYIPSQTSGNIALETTFGENNPDNPWLLSTDGFSSQPNEFKLKGNYPNPFNPVTTINFTLDITSELSMSIYNVKGESVREIKMGQIPSGVHSVVWDSKDNSGRLVSTGLYLSLINI